MLIQKDRNNDVVSPPPEEQISSPAEEQIFFPAEQQISSPAEQQTSIPPQIFPSKTYIPLDPPITMAQG